MKIEIRLQKKKIVGIAGPWECTITDHKGRKHGAFDTTLRKVLSRAGKTLVDAYENKNSFKKGQ